MTEQQPYNVVRTEPGFELRSYPQHVVAEVTVRAPFSDAGNRAFQYLFRYISGENSGSRKIAMTAPVVQSPGSSIAMTAPVVQRPGTDADTHVIAFVLPASLTEESAPRPTNSAVTLRTIPEALSAVSTYSGRWNEKGYDEHCEQLLEQVATAGLTAVGTPRFARFNPPLTPWFLRRNEVVVDVLDDKHEFD
ncbi:SOUL family heme-binding protein [Leifsonia sp. A12D58]|uniref:SOUL family heme-binding protein n=1 Tax=Leifsonia sp. A12D58 TaxID=3397674 RepID=UPI0039E1A0C6